MKVDSELEQELERLGRLLAPESSIVDRVMARIDELPSLPDRSAGRRRWLAYSAIAVATSVAVLLAWQFGFARRSIPGPATGPVTMPVAHELKPAAAEQIAERAPDQMVDELRAGYRRRKKW